jgi:hypothetical protein
MLAKLLAEEERKLEQLLSRAKNKRRLASGGISQRPGRTTPKPRYDQQALRR